MITTSFYHDDYFDTFECRQARKLSRIWTESPQVSAIFDILDGQRSDVALFTDARDASATTMPEVFAQNGVGYLNPTLEGSFAGRLWSSPASTRGWDARYAEAGGNECAKIGELPDVPACMTDYASTVFIVDNPAYIDLAVMTGQFELDEPVDDGRVFLALHPSFVEANPDIEEIVEEVRVSGKLFDIRHWKENGMLEEKTQKAGTLKVVHGYWSGPAPREIAEPVLAKRVFAAVNEVLDHAVQSYKGFDLHSALTAHGYVNLAGALMMKRGLFDFDAVELDMGAPGISPAFLKSMQTFLNENGEPNVWVEDDALMKRDFNEFLKNNNLHISEDAPCADVDVQELADNVRKLEDVVQIWNAAYDRRRIALHFDVREIEKDLIFSRTYELGKFLGIDDCIDTVDAGVPVEDILA